MSYTSIELATTGNTMNVVAITISLLIIIWFIYRIEKFIKGE